MSAHVCVHILLGLILLAVLDGRHVPDQDLLQRKTRDLLAQLTHFETVIPQLVDHQGNFISYDVTHSSALRHSNLQLKRRKRWIKQENTLNMSSQSPSVYLDGSDQLGRSSLFYKLSAFGREFHFNLTLNTQLLTKDFSVEFWDEMTSSKSRDLVWDCHYVGSSTRGHASAAAISNCNGLHGVFSTDTEDYFVEPLWNHTNVLGVQGYPHIVYSRSSLRLGNAGHCGVRDYKRLKYNKLHRKRLGSQNEVLKPKEQSAFWEWKPKFPADQSTSTKEQSRKRSRRSASTERHVETLVVMDKKMLDYHTSSPHESSSTALTTYVLTIMNIVCIYLYCVE